MDIPSETGCLSDDAITGDKKVVDSHLDSLSQTEAKVDKTDEPHLNSLSQTEAATVEKAVDSINKLSEDFNTSLDLDSGKDVKFSKKSFIEEEDQNSIEDDTSLSDDSGTENYSDAPEYCDNTDDKPEDIDDYIDDLDEDTLAELEKDMSEEEKQKHKEDAQLMKNEGNDHFKAGEYTMAIKLYSQALKKCPLQFTVERSIMYSNRAASRIKLEQKEEALTDCNKALELNPNYLKVLLRRAQLNKNMENLEQALTDYQRVLEMDPNLLEARQACMTLPEEIKERNEKLKTEMIGKLKELGNLVLRPFGLSTDNFNLIQDPNTGGYSINFQNTPSNNK